MHAQKFCVREIIPRDKLFEIHLFIQYQKIPTNNITQNSKLTINSLFSDVSNTNFVIFKKYWKTTVINMEYFLRKYRLWSVLRHHPNFGTNVGRETSINIKYPLILCNCRLVNSRTRELKILIFYFIVF